MSLRWCSDASEMDLGKRDRAYRLVVLKQEVDDEVWTARDLDGIFSVMTQEGILPRQAHVPPSAIAAIVQVNMMAGKRRLHGNVASTSCGIIVPPGGLGGAKHDSMVCAGLPAVDRGPRVHAAAIERVRGRVRWM